MGRLLAHLVLTGLAIAAPATVSLFVAPPRRPPLRAAARAVLGAGLVVAASVVLGAVAGADVHRSLLAGLLLAGVVLASGRAASAWTLRGLLAWATTIATGAAYLGYVLVWTATAHLSLAARAGSLALWVLEAFVYLLSLGYVWELVDVLARWHWSRVIDVRTSAPPAGEHAFVSLHVPTHNEPPDLVIATLERLLALEYDDYEVLVLDNNTDDPALWQPVEEFCARHERLRFFHLEDWPGFKSGALNFALTQVDARTQLVGVVDADYQVDADFLARCTPLFADASLAFVQTPQDYRDWESDGYFRRLYHSYAYFFDVSQRSRNERGGAIFGGTMGLIRRDALEAVGRWDEWCITEDAELSLRLLKAGWSGTHVHTSFGRGIMPLTFEALKRQRFRWCFGGVQMLRMHGRSLLPGPRTADNRLTLGQRWAYLVGGLQWFGELTGVLFTGFLLLGAANIAWGSGDAVRRFSAPLLIGVIGLIVLGSLRSLALIRRSSGSSWGEALGALGLWMALGWAVAQASARGLVAREGVFLRTPKTRGDVGWRDAVRGNRAECLLALVCAVGIAGSLAGWLSGAGGGALVVAVLLALQGAGYLAAPLNSLAAINADLTPELRRRRREALLSWTRVAPGVRRWGVAPVLAGSLAMGLLLLVAAPTGSPLLQDLPHTALRPTPAADATHRARPHRTPAPATSATGGPSSSPAPTVSSTTVAGRPRVTSTPTATATATTPTATTGPTATPTAVPTTTPTATPTPSATPTQRPTSRPSPTSHPTPPPHP